MSQRLPISVLENAVSNAERRSTLLDEDRVVPRVSDVYAAVPSITGKLELEYEGEMAGGDTIARELIRKAAGATLEARAPDVDLEPIVEWFDQGGALRISNEEPAEISLRGFDTVPGLVDAVVEGGLASRTSPAHAVAACELILEALASHKRISGSEELGWTRARPKWHG